MKTNNQLITACKKKYGRFWQARLAESLGINSRTVRTWASGRCKPSPAYVILITAALKRGTIKKD